MTIALKLLIRVIRRRVAAGERLEEVLTDYPRLTDEERDTVEAEASGRPGKS